MFEIYNNVNISSNTSTLKRFNANKTRLSRKNYSTSLLVFDIIYAVRVLFRIVRFRTIFYQEAEELCITDVLCVDGITLIGVPIQ